MEAFSPAAGFEDLDFNFYDGFKQCRYGNPNPGYAGYNLHRDSDSGDYIMLPGVDNSKSVGLFGR